MGKPIQNFVQLATLKQSSEITEAATTTATNNSHTMWGIKICKFLQIQIFIRIPLLLILSQSRCEKSVIPPGLNTQGLGYVWYAYLYAHTSVFQSPCTSKSSTLLNALSHRNENQPQTSVPFVLLLIFF